MNIKFSFFAIIGVLLLLASCSKENIDTTTEEEENPTEVVECNLNVNIEVDSTAGSGFTYTAVVEGGTSPYSYNWTTGQNTQSIEVETLEDQLVVVTDAEGCTALDTILFQIVDPCNNLTGGIEVDSFGILLTAWVSGGTGPYSYQWSTGATTESIEVTVSGDYEVVIEDAEGCTFSYTYNYMIADPCSSLTAFIQQDTLGTQLIAIANGGSGSYTYEWSTGETSSEIEVTENGVYSVTIADAQGCIVFTSIEVMINGSSCDSFGVGISQDTLGTVITAFPFGGTSPYSYFWSDGQTSNSISGEVGNSYEVSVTDSAGCLAVDSIIVQ